MYQNNTQTMLKNLSELILNGTLTPTDQVDLQTFVCFTEKTPVGLAYHQWPFDQIPETHKQLFHGRLKGEVIGNFKVVAVFDVWEIGIQPASRMKAAV